MVSSCKMPSQADLKSQIVKVTDFELSPDEDKIAFSALTPVGNSDIWVVNIDGTGLKKLTFKDRSPSNHIARFFQKHGWRGFFTISMIYPKWTNDNRIVFCKKLTKHDTWGTYTLDEKYLVINQDGSNEKIKTDKNNVLRRKPLKLIHSYELIDQSDKHKKKIFIKDNILWVLGFGETNPRKLIQ
jgi:hypothetical protein